MWEFIFSTLWGWWGVAGVVVIVCVIVGYFVPSLRLAMLAIGGAFIAGASIYSKGQRDRAALEKRRKEQAVKKVKEDYAKIDARPDSPDTVSKRLHDRSF